MSERTPQEALLFEAKNTLAALKRENVSGPCYFAVVGLEAAIESVESTPLDFHINHLTAKAVSAHDQAQRVEMSCGHPLSVQRETSFGQARGKRRQFCLMCDAIKNEGIRVRLEMKEDLRRALDRLFQLAGVDIDALSRLI